MEAIKSGTAPIRENIDSDLPEDHAVAPIAPLEVNLPEIAAPFIYLKELFFSSPMAIQTGMGITRLTWEEFKAWREENELDLMVWEKRILMKMSDAYCTEYAKAKEPNAPAPYVPEREEAEEATVSDKIAQAIKLREQMKLFRKKK